MRILFIKMRLQHVELFVSLMNGLCGCATEFMVCLLQQGREATAMDMLVCLG